jgi:hypothetical protein
MSLNLHHIVRAAVTFNNADQTLTLYRSLGTFSRDPATMQNVPNVAAGVSVSGQVQSIKSDEIVQTERVSFSETVRKLYLYSTSAPGDRPWGTWRPLSRTGDYVLDANGNYWYVDAVVEDFTESGWVSLQVILQTTPPTLNIVEEGGNVGGG